ncbi:phenylacetate--CoA ligase family protein [Pelagibius sp.]|uniref:phenylacetate--CoA ligase family protein n=1 Tax=Pelagibius sp. TaxID=1931238 RepID=UPI0026187D67|nr:hypothetical protein [Pelagibius sp.]
MVEATSLEREREEQARWRPLPQGPRFPIFEQLVENEFQPPEVLLAQQGADLRKLVAFAVQRVPYYRDLFERLKLTPADVVSAADLLKLPLLSKRLILENERRLQPDRLPAGEKFYGVFASSGTTGRPTQVAHTHNSNLMFTVMGQRHVRWCRWDPMDKVAEIRLPHQLPVKPDGSAFAPGETCRRPGWRYLGGLFQTGPYAGLNVFTPMEERIDWVYRERPAHLTGASEILEQMAFACQDRAPPPGLLSTRAISEQLTEPMRRRIEDTFKVPVHQNYGLNEVGIIAGLCPAGRYHINSEHCIVEILDEDLQPCPPGTAGRLVVTALKNPAMPLLRYDTDDLATAVDGLCPCGRTLPAFDDIVGRYSRIAFLPPGTLVHVEALRDELQAMPQELMRNLRQFQVHQFRDGRFEMRLCTVGPLPDAFGARLHEAWQGSIGEEALSLELIEVEEIARPPSGKYQDFTSDFFPSAGSDARPDPTVTRRP